MTITTHQPTVSASNPFALMLDPETVFAAIANSDHLARLTSRICRPLDKPLIAHADDESGDSPDSADIGAFDDATDDFVESFVPVVSDSVASMQPAQAASV